MGKERVYLQVSAPAVNEEIDLADLGYTKKKWETLEEWEQFAVIKAYLLDRDIGLEAQYRWGCEYREVEKKEKKRWR